MTTDNTSRNTPERMDVPFVRLATFTRQPACPDWDRLDGAEVADPGVPIDTASSYRAGARARLTRSVSKTHPN
jgi:agmatinase